MKIWACDDFRFVATMNDDASTFDLPDYIYSRLMPMIASSISPSPTKSLPSSNRTCRFPTRADPEVRGGLPPSSPCEDQPFTVRDGVNWGAYAFKRPSRRAAGRNARVLAVDPARADDFIGVVQPLSQS